MLSSSGQCLQASTPLLRPTPWKRNCTLKAKNYKKLKTNVTRWGCSFTLLSLFAVVHFVHQYFIYRQAIYSYSYHKNSPPKGRNAKAQLTDWILLYFHIVGLCFPERVFSSWALLPDVMCLFGLTGLIQIKQAKLILLFAALQPHCL